MPSLLLIDPNPDVMLGLLRRSVRVADLTVHFAESADEGLAFAERVCPDVIVLDVEQPDRVGTEVIPDLRRAAPSAPIVFVTGYATTNLAIEAIRLGAFEYLFQPVDLAQLEEVIDRALVIRGRARVALETTHAHCPPPSPPDDRPDMLIGRCPRMQEVYKSIGRVADQDVTVLITGESGTGKDLVARAICQHSRRSAKPFLAINCAAIPESLLESELFGHEKGAFTGADRQRMGKFEQYSGGTIFLDEVGDMPLLTQSKVLRLLQEQRFERVGGNVTIHTDVRIIAATNKPLDTLVASGSFRPDLYYRLSTFTIRVPSLALRDGDLPLLVETFLRRFSREMGKDVRTVDPDAMALLRAYPWPGNVRELQSVVKQSLLNATGSVLLPEFLPELLRTRLGDPAPDAAADEPGVLHRFIRQRLDSATGMLYDEVLHQMERSLFNLVLRHTAGSQLRAARVLGISRARLRRKLRDLGITVTRSVNGEDEPNE